MLQQEQAGGKGNKTQPLFAQRNSAYLQLFGEGLGRRKFCLFYCLLIQGPKVRPGGRATAYSCFFPLYLFILLFPLITHITDDFIRVWCAGTAEVRTSNRKLGRMSLMYWVNNRRRWNKCRERETERCLLSFSVTRKPTENEKKGCDSENKPTVSHIRHEKGNSKREAL